MRADRLTRPRRQRLARVLILAAWWGAVGYFVREVVRTRDANGEHLVATLVLAYLGVWCPVLALARWRPAGKLARFAACTASIAAAFAVVEIPAALGRIDYREVFHTPTPPWKRSGNLPDPDLLFERKPNQRLTFRFQGSDLHGLRDAPATTYTCDVAMDDRGFRNPPGLDAAEVVLIGDSFVEGLQVTDDELVSARLAERIGAPVANLGRTGYGPQQELAVLKRHAAGFGPRACVWFFYEGNDLQDLEGYDSQRERVRALRPESFKRAWRARSFVRNAAGWLMRPGSRDGVPARERAGLLDDGTAVYFSCGVHEGSPEAVADRARPETAAKLRGVFQEAADVCRKRGTDLIVAFVPAKFRVYHDLCRFDASSSHPSWPVDDLPGFVGVAARAAGADYLDLTPALRSAAEAGPLVYLADDTHWSPAGHRAAAAAIAERIRRDSDINVLPPSRGKVARRAG